VLVQRRINVLLQSIVWSVTLRTTESLKLMNMPRTWDVEPGGKRCLRSLDTA
jgi:hypothetical protein